MRHKFYIPLGMPTFDQPPVDPAENTFQAGDTYFNTVLRRVVTWNGTEWVTGGKDIIPGNGLASEPGPNDSMALHVQIGTGLRIVNDVVVLDTTHTDVSYVKKSGDTMFGPLSVPTPPTLTTHAASKKYVDDSVKTVSDALVSYMPTGSIVMYGGSSAPSGWHLCDGSAHGSGLLQAITGSVTTPDLRGKFVLGASPTYGRGSTGGAPTVKLTANQSGLRDHGHAATAGTVSADHVHSGTTSGHSVDHGHRVTAGTTGGGGHAHNSAYGNNWQGSTQDQNPAGTDYGPIGWNAPNVGGTFSAGGHEHSIDVNSGGASVDHTHTFTSGGISANHVHTITVNASGSAEAAEFHENMPPYYVATYIIKKT